MYLKKAEVPLSYPGALVIAIAQPLFFIIAAITNKHASLFKMMYA
jgi:hypothetical protein